MNERVLLTISTVSPQGTHHGVDPKHWEVASSFSTIDDESVRTRSLPEDSVPGSNKSEGGPGKFAPNTHAHFAYFTLLPYKDDPVHGNSGHRIDLI